MEEPQVRIREVWRRNFAIEMARIDSKLGSYKMVAFDTEFPGFLRNTPREASEEDRFRDLKFNVDHLKLIQLGLTLFDDDGRIGGTWQFNFCDFDVNTDLQVDASIRLLRTNGINFEKNRLEGVEIGDFAARLKGILENYQEIKWVSFHGLYDLGYFLRVLTQSECTPDSMIKFAEKAGEVLGCVYDVKFMAKYCNGLMDGLLGLEKLSKILMVERLGEAHQAGSDSLLTARVFLKMVKAYGLVTDAFEGYLFGISAKIEKMVRGLIPFDSPHHYYPCFPRRPWQVNPWYQSARPCFPHGAYPWYQSANTSFPHGASQGNPRYHSARVLVRPLLLQVLPAVP